MESVVAAFGANFNAAQVGASAAPLPVNLAGTSVIVTDSSNVARPAGLYFVTPGQVNFQLPAGLAAGTATVTIYSPLGYSIGTITVAVVRPVLFSADSSGAGLLKGYALRTSGGVQTLEQVTRFDPATFRWVAVPVAALRLICTGACWMRFQASPSSRRK